MDLELIEKLIKEINRIHFEFSLQYFKDMETFNLSKTIKHIPTSYIYNYRLALHEAINDYLIVADLQNVTYQYRVKTRESLEFKINKVLAQEEQYPTNNFINDIFGARIVLNSEEIEFLKDNKLDKWKEIYSLKNWYERDKDGYKGIHVYFKNKNNVFFPWELQIWDKESIYTNIVNHRKYKRSFL